MHRRTLNGPPLRSTKYYGEIAKKKTAKAAFIGGAKASRRWSTGWRGNTRRFLAWSRRRQILRRRRERHELFGAYSHPHRLRL